jgi:hypothetical protein
MFCLVVDVIDFTGVERHVVSDTLLTA